MGKKFLTREEQEKTEGYKTQEVDVPESRFQTEQQKVPATSANKTGTNNAGFNKKKMKAEGSVLKQEVAARVLDTGVGGEIPESAASVRGLSYSGNAGTILGSAAYTPIVGQSRAESRTGKKLDAIAKKLNFVPSEQVEEEYDESKPLASDPSATQGYNGTFKNTNARMQKNVGGVPGDLMFQRSIDEVKRDQLYFSTGQVVKQQGVIYADTPTYIPEKDNNGVYHYGTEENYELVRGNYLHRAMKIKFDNFGRLTQMKFDVLDCSTELVDANVVNDASANELIDMNYAELDRQVMDNKAGDEKAEIWTPLARAIKQPTRTVGYLRDIENITGSEVFLAYKKTSACMSYQLNRASKDGLKLVAPMLEACTGLIKTEHSSIDYSNTSVNTLWTDANYKAGAASLFIAIYDSVAKYNNKADLLTQPRSFKLALQAADNNMNPLRIKADLVKVINSREVFSTIDREYDPLQPVCISDREALIHCYNFNDLYAFEELNEAGAPVFTKNPFTYCYSDLRNSYLVASPVPLLRGLHKYLDSIGPKVISLNNGALINQEITIPMIHSTCFFSLWSLFLLAAVPFITRERINALRDVLYYEKNIGYPFSQLITLKEANPMNALQYSNTDYQNPLVVKRMTPSCALTWVLPEVFWPFDEGVNEYKYVLPWYFNQVDFKFETNDIIRADGKYSMSMPSIRSGVRFGYLDDIYSMSERDVRLSLDRLVNIPETDNGTNKQGVYKYSQNSDGIPFVSINDSAFTPELMLALPRELGWFVVAPAGVLAPVNNGTRTNDFLRNDDPLFGQSSYLIKFWHGRKYNPSADINILDATTINVNRATAYKQDWDAIPATIFITNNNSVKDWGFTASICELFGNDADAYNMIDGKSLFIPFTNGVSTNGAEEQYNIADYKVISLQKAIWTRIQKLPFAISPWDMRAHHRNLGNDAIKFDPYDFLYYFGLAGFKASEYDEDVYNRSNEIVNQGFSFLHDPFVNDSPLFKEAGLSTQSTNTADLIK